MADDPAYDASPDWSPDGTRIAFYSPNRHISGWGYGIYVMNVDGSGQTNLTNNPQHDLLPDWSPDGTRIRFAPNRDGQFEIYAMNTDGSGQTNLTCNSFADVDPAWRP